MTEPLVCCVMITRDRPEMVARAVRCFRAQTYRNKRLLIYDNGQEPAWRHDSQHNEVYFRCLWNAHRGMLSIGALRNEANGHSDDVPWSPDILIHWDDDDLSHPNRIAEQVELLQSSGKECVGYREMLFWHACRGEAWLYHNADPRYCLGTSLCYWRSVWEKRPFPDLHPTGRGEDKEWLRGVDSMGVSAQGELTALPRMIATIHAQNAKFYDAALKPDAASWRRTPEWDDYVRRTVEAA